ncbi:hypothetical protein BRYFOR_05587 [Marvinbryantia formatexigens DSM 14469]|uniref:Uncharacterized protein n=1 Tax=Marvinbryantia formatexigens DSM 14469 TaxID=478749 RepID=C6LAE5_9FIRM|nr:hypothetical protein BRYFOR_05587 [Marvinbryantia formatexigens DSM 14469]
MIIVIIITDISDYLKNKSFQLISDDKSVYSFLFTCGLCITTEKRKPKCQF